MDVITTVSDQINNNECISMSLLDFKKAFDAVKHSILTKKIERYGIRGVTLNFLISFLTNRKQYVAHKNRFSDVAINELGVPQVGSLKRTNDLFCFCCSHQ